MEEKPTDPDSPPSASSEPGAPEETRPANSSPSTADSEKDRIVEDAKARVAAAKASYAAMPGFVVQARDRKDDAAPRVGFTATLGLKDANLILAAGDQARVPLPSANTYRDRLLGAIAHGDGEKDWAVIAKEQCRASGMD